MKRILIFIVVIVITSGTVLGTAFAMDYFKKPQQPKSGIHMVSLLEDKAEPNALLIHKGEFVQFNSRDGKSHHLSPGRGNSTKIVHEHTGMGLESGVFGPDEAYKVQFKKVGTYEFHDHDNPDIFITVLVYDPTN